MAPTLDAATLAEAFQTTAAANSDQVALRDRDDGVRITWAQYGERVERIAAGLAALGVGRRDTVGLMLANRPEFHLADTAAVHLGAVPFSVYNTSTAEQVGYLFADAANSVIFTERAFLDVVLEARESAAALEHVIVVDGEAGEGTLSLEQLEAGGEDGFEFEAAWRAVEPDDLLTLIYTSGTTGPPKGVQLSHANMMAAVNSYAQVLDLAAEGRVVSWLPMAHIAERNTGHYLPILYGYTTTCCPDPRQVVAYLAEVHPTSFFAVPRIWEKLMAAMEVGFAAEGDEAKAAAIEAAIELGRRRVRAEQAGEQLSAELREQHEQADAQVLAPLRERIGLDQTTTVGVGAAPTPPEVLEFFHALGIPLGELWGLSETCGAGACNPTAAIRIGTVGPAMPGVELKLAEDGEVLLRGPVTMAGYRNDGERTAETIDSEAWLHTGDVGEFDADGYLRIVDRKKELIINSAGKNMSPANIEAKIKAASPLIGQVCAVGDDRPYNVALIVLDPDAAAAFAAEQGIEGGVEQLASAPAVLEQIGAGVERGNEALARVEQIKKFKLLAAEWEPGGVELTPTMKLKRRPIEHRYEDEIEALYSD